MVQVLVVTMVQVLVVVGGLVQAQEQPCTMKLKGAGADTYTVTSSELNVNFVAETVQITGDEGVKLVMDYF